MSWEPIETAPKTARVLLLMANGEIVCGEWDDNRHNKTPRPYWTTDRERLWGVVATRDNQPTHWMPLPAPPTE